MIVTIFNLTWQESVKKDLKDWNITKELAMDRGVWKLAIHVPEPWIGCEILWVSALAYPKLFGTKGFVVVDLLLYYDYYKFPVIVILFLDTTCVYCT